MKELDDFLRTTLDSYSKAPIAAASMDAGLVSKVDAAQRAQIERLRDYAKAHPDNALVKANQHLLPQLDDQTWTAAGNASMTSFIWWALGGVIGFPGTPFSFTFSGKGGPNWAAATFTAVMGGKFTVSPGQIANSPSCNFNLAEGGLGIASGIVMNLWGTDGTPGARLGACPLELAPPA
jgi:hypothetical protein